MIKSSNFLLIIIFILQTVIGLIFGAGNFSYLFNIIISQVFAILIPLILFLALKKRRINIKNTDLSIFHVIVAIICTLCIEILSQYINIPVLHIMERFDIYPTEVYVPNGVFEFAAMFIFIAIVPAVIEEYLFRKVVLDEYRGAYGNTRAIILCGLSFALMHGNISSLIPQFMMGTFLSYIAVKFDGIYISVICHFVHNASLLIIQKFFYGEVSEFYQNNILINLLVFTLILVCGIYIIGKTKMENTYVKREISKKHTDVAYWAFITAAVALNIILT